MRTSARGTLLRVVSLAAVLFTVGVTAGVVATASPASANTTGAGEAAFISATNSARAAVGRPALRVASDLTSIARRWSATMAAKGDIWHNPNLTTEVANWQVVGENVGMGPTVDDIQRAFMNSQHHRDNILDTDYTEIGIGTVTDNRGEIFVTEVFRRPFGAVSQPAPSAPRHPVTTVRRAVVAVPAVDLGRQRLVTATRLSDRAHGTVGHALSYPEVLAALAS